MSASDTQPNTEGAAVLWSKTGLAVISFWLLIGGVYLIPSPLQRLLQTATEPALSKPSMPTVQSTPPAPQPARPAPAPGDVTEKRPVANAGGYEPIQGPERALAGFARALARTASNEPGAITRVVHYGDSLIDLDHITAPLRRLFHERYGDAGHGFSLVAKPWPWYNQHGLVLARGSGWAVSRLIGRRGDGWLGLGFSAAESSGGTRWLRLRATPSVRFSRVEVSFLRQPGGGTIALLVDGALVKRFSTAGRREAGYHRVTVADGPHQLRLRTAGRVRIFGAVLEREGPGVVWDNLPLVSARFHQLTRINADHWKEQLAHRKPALVVFQFGANDTLNYGGDLQRYGQRIGVVIDRMHAAVPAASCLVIGPLDRLMRSGGRLRSPGVVRRVSDRQRMVALAHGCAFWDGQKGMGGPGAMRRWLDQGLALKDMVHLNPKGGAKLARALARALSAALAGHGLSTSPRRRPRRN